MTDRAVLPVDAYLQSCEDRHPTKASDALGLGARLQFSGAVEYASLIEMVQAAAGKNRWVRKHRDRYALGQPNGRFTVASSTPSTAAVAFWADQAQRAAA